ncbi:MAG: class I SAM-dependent methyltransferase [Flavobacteriales bacterium]|nr:class I SAM-dependent methyltransferase [Flavobacteriales bacterium]
MHQQQDDTENITYLSDTERIFSEEGQKFQGEKYLPKIERVRQYLRPDAQRSLDVGIGYGLFMIFTERELGLTSHGLDPFPKSIEIARQYTSAEIKEGAIEDSDWQYPEGHFDFISCLDVTEHLEEPAAFYRNVQKYLAPGGLVLMTTPNRSFAYEMRSWPLIGIPDKNTTHINVQAPSYWDRLAKEHGFEIVDSWRGEHLTHVRVLPGLMQRFCNVLGLDPKTTPVVNRFQQAYNQILRVK